MPGRTDMRACAGTIARLHECTGTRESVLRDAAVEGVVPPEIAWHHLGAPQVADAGGHVHVGGVEDINPKTMVRMLDLTVGLLDIFDTDTRRREFYGQPGRYRDKPYGVEYRSLSNFWIQKDSTIEMVYDGVIQAANLVDMGADPRDFMPNGMDMYEFMCTRDRDISFSIHNEVMQCN